MAPSNVLGLDIGEKRVGVARVNIFVGLPVAIITLANNDLFINKLSDLVREYEVDTLVIGLPRNLKGQETKQSDYIRDFCNKNIMSLGLPIIFQDETLSSVEAQKILDSGTVKNQDIDSLAACIILEDYLKEIKR